MIHPRLLSILSRPWAMSPDVQRTMFEAVQKGMLSEARAFNVQHSQERINALSARHRGMNASGSSLFQDGDEDAYWFDPYYDAHIRPSGVAVVPVRGPLVDRAWCGFCGYDQLLQNLRDVRAEWEARKSLKDVAQIQAVVMPCDSPGGMADGQAELRAYMRDLREEIPIYFVVDNMACSAACVLALQASEILVNPDSSLGHYGIFTVHEDVSEQLAKAGIKVTYIAMPSASKTFFASEVPLTDAALATYRKGVEYGWQKMLEAAQLGAEIDEQTVRGWDAAIWYGLEAIDVGVATKNLTFTELLNMIEQ
jgi:ClpP class serine protease